VLIFQLSAKLQVFTLKANDWFVFFVNLRYAAVHLILTSAGGAPPEERRRRSVGPLPAVMNFCRAKIGLNTTLVVQIDIFSYLYSLKEGNKRRES